jgi:RNA recognition motif-containing protein
LFSQYGVVEKCNIMRDPHTRESRGFGFVKMATPEDADHAKEKLQGEVYEGRTLSIEKARRARPRTPTPGKYFGPPKRGASHPFFPSKHPRMLMYCTDDRPPRGGYRDRYYEVSIDVQTTTVASLTHARIVDTAGATTVVEVEEAIATATTTEAMAGAVAMTTHALTVTALRTVETIDMLASAVASAVASVVAEGTVAAAAAAAAGTKDHLVDHHHRSQPVEQRIQAILATHHRRVTITNVVAAMTRRRGTVDCLNTDIPGIEWPSSMSDRSDNGGEQQQQKLCQIASAQDSMRASARHCTTTRFLHFSGCDLQHVLLSARSYINGRTLG